MTTFSGRYWLTFDSERMTRPIIYEMSKKFDVVFNIRQASISKNVGLMALELEGERSTVKEVISWLEAQGLEVDPVEINTIEG